MTTILPNDAVILAGGLGTRLQGILPDGWPKAMAPINGRPFLEYLIKYLYAYGVRNIVLALGHGGEHVLRFVREASWPDDLIVHSAVEPRPLGTGGGIRFVLPMLSGEVILALNGDSISDIDPRRLLDYHRERGADVTMALARVPDATRYGTVECDAHGRVVRFAEKQAICGPALINSGMYAISTDVIRGLAEHAEMSWERDVLTQLVGCGLYGIEAATRFIDIGTPQSLHEAGPFFERHSALQ